MKINKAIVLELLLSLIIIGALLYYAGAKDVARIVLKAKPELLALSLLSLLCVHLAMAYRVRMVLEYLGHRVRYATVLSCHFSGMIASDFTPARSGYFTTAFALERNHKVPLEKAMVAILGPQMFDFMLKVVTGTIAVWYMASFFLPKDSATGLYIFAGVLVIGAMIAVGLLLLFSRKFAELLRFIVLLPFGKRAHDLMLNMQNHSHAIRALLPQLLGLLLVTWAFKALSWLFLAESVGIGLAPGIEVPAIVFFAFLQPLITMLEFVPTPTLAGMGVSEAGISAVLVLFSVSPSAAVAFALLNRFLTIALDSVGVREALRALRLV